MQLQWMIESYTKGIQQLRGRIEELRQEMKQKHLDTITLQQLEARRRLLSEEACAMEEACKKMRSYEAAWAQQTDQEA